MHLDVVVEVHLDVVAGVRPRTDLVGPPVEGGIGAGLFGAAGYCAISALSILYFAAAFGLAAAADMSYWLAFLLVGVALLVIAGICGGIGFMLIRKVKAPEKTIAAATATVDDVKAAAQHAIAAAKAPQLEGRVVSPKAIS